MDKGRKCEDPNICWETQFRDAACQALVATELGICAFILFLLITENYWTD